MKIVPVLLVIDLERPEKVLLEFNADPWNVRQPDHPVGDRQVVGETAEWLKHARIGFVAVQPQPRREVQRHLMSAVRDAPARGPSRVVLSGILSEQRNELCAAYAPWFRMDEVLEDEGWVCLAGTRRE